MTDDRARENAVAATEADLAHAGRTMLEALTDEVVLIDSSGTILAVNEAWRRFCSANGGNTDTHYVGWNYFGICGQATGQCTAEAPIVADGLRQLLAEGGEFRCEYPCDSETERRWFELTAGRLPWQGGHALLVQHRNITARHRTSDDIERSALQGGLLAALVATTRDAILAYDLNGNILTWNPGAQDLYQYKEHEVVGKSLEILYPEGWPKRLTEYRDEIIAGRLTGFEAVRVAKDGSERQVWITCAPIRSPEGDVIAVSNIHRDVTELRKAEEARELITQEVIHRAKNMLTIVSSIQRQTARNATSLEDFHEKFGNRIAALSETTDMLVQGSWTTVALDRLVERHMAPFMQGVAHKVRVDGPVVELLPQAVQTIGMSLHELATNSAKYGALQTETGAIEITWRIEMGSTGQPQMRFEWLENGIHFRAPEGRSGFGQTVLTSLSQSMLNAEAAFEATPNSLRWKLAMPANHFRDLA